MDKRGFGTVRVRWSTWKVLLPHLGMEGLRSVHAVSWMTIAHETSEFFINV